MAASSPTDLYCKLRNLRPKFDMVLRFAVNSVSTQLTKNGVGRKRASEIRWGVVWIECRRSRDQVRTCCYLCRVNADIPFRSLV